MGLEGSRVVAVLLRGLEGVGSGGGRGCCAGEEEGYGGAVGGGAEGCFVEEEMALEGFGV